MLGSFVQAVRQAATSLRLLPLVQEDVLSSEGDAASGADHHPFLCDACIAAFADQRDEPDYDSFLDESEALSYAMFEFGVWEEAGAVMAEIFTCTGCGAYSTNQGAEHACWRDPITGQREVGGSFQ